MNPPPPPKGPPKQQETATRPPSAARSQQLSRSDATPVKVARAVLEKRPYHWMAFANPYNLSLLLGSISVAAITQEPILGLVALSAEALWLVFGPESKLLQRWVWDPAIERGRRAAEARGRESLVASLPTDERRRVEVLAERQEQIRRLAAQNPSFTGELLRSEISKTNRLVDAFVEMALTRVRYEQYLVSINPPDLVRERDRFRETVRTGRLDPQQSQIAQKNLEIVEKRLERVEEIRRFLSVARGQLELIENSFQLIADQIVTMQSPKELSGQLDELLDGVEAIREAVRDTESLLGTVDKEL